MIVGHFNRGEKAMTALHRLEREFCDQVAGITEEQALELLEEHGSAIAVEHIAELGGKILRGSGLSPDNPYN